MKKREKTDLQQAARLWTTLLKHSVICFLLLGAFATQSAVFTVNDLGDAGAGAGTDGDLRYCINQANGIAGPHTIEFSVAGEIILTAALPAFTQQITVDGPTAPGYIAGGPPVIGINGNGAAGWGFLLNAAGADGSQFMALAIYNCQFNAINSPDANNIVIDGCHIGVDVTGNGGIGNGDNGLMFTNTNGHQILNSVISNNGGHGIQLNNSNDALLQGNTIGLRRDGTATLPNAFSGIQLGPNALRAVIGGAAADERNIISGNTQQGVEVLEGCNEAQFINNYIGVDPAGNGPGFGNGLNGVVYVASGVNPSNDGLFDGNVISGNGAWGLNIFDGDNIHIANNHIGINSAGNAAIPNGTDVALNGGVDLKNSDNPEVINNVLSGNNDVGLRLENSNNPIIQGNHIGINAAGDAAIPNNSFGLWSTGSDNMLLGGTGIGEGNVFSANTLDGAHVENAPGVEVYQNIFGLNAAGTGALGNNGAGFNVVNCPGIIVGGTTAAHRNIFSANGAHGGTIGFSDNVVFEGNYVGTNINGTGPAATFGNRFFGFSFWECNTVRIGGDNTNQRNIFSGNGQLWGFGVAGNGYGLLVNTTNTEIKGNYFGVEADGTTPMSNTEHGIFVFNGTGIQIGGNTAAQRNVIAGNGFHGILILSEGCCANFPASDHVIIGNYIGVDATGNTPLGNGLAGPDPEGASGIISIFGNNITIGRANAGEGNVLSNNGEFGIHFVGGVGGTIYNNYIGVGADGITAMGNRDGGISITGVGGGGNDYIVGGLGALQPNIIAHSTGTGLKPLGNGFGIGVESDGGGEGIQNTFRGNSIYCNEGLGIDLNFGNSFSGLGVGNTGIAAPVLTLVQNDDPSITIEGEAWPSVTIDFYANPEPCFDCEAKVYIGSYTVPGGGAPTTLKDFTTTFVPLVPVNSIALTRVTAIATDGSGNSSEISPCIDPMPVSWLSFDARLLSSGEVALAWSTATEENNDYFIVERSTDGQAFKAIGTVNGAGNTDVIQHYLHNDATPPSGTVYYRLTQVDYDGTHSYSTIVSVNTGAVSISVYPNPVKDVVEIHGLTGTVTLEVTNAVGQAIRRKVVDTGNAPVRLNLTDLSGGVYILYMHTTSGVFSEKIVKH